MFTLELFSTNGAAPPVRKTTVVLPVGQLAVVVCHTGGAGPLDDG